jgi:hypothetical protein
MKVVQDDAREEELARVFNLTRPGNRIRVDAYDENLTEYELKTTSKGSVSTARDLGYSHLDKWKNQYWIVADFENHSSGFQFTNFWFLAPYHMKLWYSTIQRRLDEDKKITDTAISILKQNNADDSVVQRIQRLCNDGALLNDPNIPKGYIRKHGFQLKPCPDELRKLVKEFPLDYRHPADDFFIFKQSSNS